MNHYWWLPMVTAWLTFSAVMPLSDKVKQKAYRDRIRSDPVKYAAYLERDRKRGNKARNIADKSERGQRQQRREWKVRQQRSRARRKELKKQVPITPPQSPDGPNANPDVNPGHGVDVHGSRQRRQGEVQRSRNRTRLNSQIRSLQHKLEQTERDASRYRKRWQRLVSSNPQESPRSKTRRLLRYGTTEDVRKIILFHNVVMEQIRTKYNHTREERDRQVFSRLLTGSIIKKYKMKYMIQKHTGLSQKRFICKKETTGFQKLRCMSTSKKLANGVQEFFCRDDNSRLTAGTKQTVTRENSPRDRSNLFVLNRQKVGW